MRPEPRGRLSELFPREPTNEYYRQVARNACGTTGRGMDLVNRMEPRAKHKSLAGRTLDHRCGFRQRAP
jgi:hypothetical protein